METLDTATTDGGEVLHLPGLGRPIISTTATRSGTGESGRSRHQMPELRPATERQATPTEPMPRGLEATVLHRPKGETQSSDYLSVQVKSHDSGREGHRHN